jgi:ACS family tartrate transporter-like MFS transporter
MAGPPESLAPAPAPELGKDEPAEAAVMAKVTLRLIPFLFLLYVVNILDRANCGIARLQMVDEQKLLSERAYGFGFGVFYIGYLLFEVPSNLILARTGARAWIARILVTWGIVSSCMMFVTGPWSFYLLRVLLGFAEAGFFPGIILYLSHWFPARARARAVAQFMTAGLVASIIGNPVSGALLDSMDQVAGLDGWKWLFLLEGIPAIVLGFVTLYYLTDRPEQATWLSAPERDWLVRRLEQDGQQHVPGQGHTLRAALGHPLVWLLIAVYFTVALGDNTFGSYLGKFLKETFPSCTTTQIGFLAAVPSMAAIIAMLVVGAHSDRTGERRWHVAGAAFTAAAGWTLAAVTSSPTVFFLALIVTVVGMKCMLPTFWAIPTAFLSGTGAAGGIALINSVANLGGLAGPTIMGYTKETTESFSVGMVVMAVALGLGGLLILAAPTETGLRVPRGEEKRVPST